MQRSRHLLALHARLQAALSACGGSVTAAHGGLRGWSSASTRLAWQPAEHATQQQSQRPVQVAATAGARRATRGFADAAVTQAGPAPRGASTGGSGRSLWSGLFLLAPGALAAFLGKWQWDRREWKRELLERRESMMQARRVAGRQGAGREVLGCIA